MSTNYWNDTLEAAENRIADWFERGSGGNVSNPVRDMVNRACDYLWQYRPWDFMAKQTTLTVSNLQASLPSDFGRILRVGSDTNGDGLLDYLYFRNHRNPQRRYRMVATYAKATGRTWVLAFAVAPSSTVTLVYMPMLDHFTADDAAASTYLPFPSDLIVLAAQSRHILEKGLTGAEMQGIVTAMANELRDFAQAHQYSNAAPDMATHDANMRETTLEGATLTGETQTGTTGFDTTYDDRR